VGEWDVNAVHPIKILAVPSDGHRKFVAGTSLAGVADDPDSTRFLLQGIELEYRTAVAAAREALQTARRGRRVDPRAYWWAAKYINDFLERLKSYGFFLENASQTLCRDLAVSRSSITKMLAFYRRVPDPGRIDPAVSWNRYRENKC
jgi:hypothetical protein